ncbi:hypothetical protein RFI_06059 [Reticulomyxa filosa]|uniref:ABC-2 type transporter transmembrane domain-containing protein n=1 Tax=Reticulomyxa filosa TaxID=46433 RepID=X6NYJ0_RETFI|nr:hypothetical protein RFI_06059 [Reticulomyxa filosa]|eukprot:ETO31061.1 hypothetical protein RFI_06059 [Reticulomyxa filosa]
MKQHWTTAGNFTEQDATENCWLMAPLLPWKQGVYVCVCVCERNIISIKCSFLSLSKFILVEIKGKNIKQTFFFFCYFKSEDDLNDYCTNNDYAEYWNVTTDNGKRPISIAIVFNTPQENGLQWSYEIRANSSRVPGTLSQLRVDKFERDMDTLWDNYASTYEDSGFVQLQVFVDNAITEYIAIQTGQSVDTVQNYTYGMTKGFQVFPTASYESDNYWSNVYFAFTWFIIFGFVYPFNQVASELVHEKSFKTKEGMKMMGATVATYWTGLFFLSSLSLLLLNCKSHFYVDL